jgi:hypothetical protein
MKPRPKTPKLALLLAIPTTIMLTSGCQTFHRAHAEFEKWRLEEFSEHYTAKQDPKKFTSTNPNDFIHPDGWATAIPTIADWDLYISPYAPDKFVRSKEPAGAKVICPYSGKPLIIGDRKKINDIDPQ